MGVTLYFVLFFLMMVIMFTLIRKLYNEKEQKRKEIELLMERIQELKNIINENGIV